jgi:hypothetical protein
MDLTFRDHPPKRASFDPYLISWGDRRGQLHSFRNFSLGIYLSGYNVWQFETKLRHYRGEQIFSQHYVVFIVNVAFDVIGFYVLADYDAQLF